ncbi:MAG: membrane dipeptidase [Firmicutes bacterium]|nr:membrane dipeptidase [Bacillota bacterium]
MVDLHNDIYNECIESARKCGVTAVLSSVWTTNEVNPLLLLKQHKGLLHIEDLWFANDDNIDDIVAAKPHSVGLTWNADNALAGGAHGSGDLTELGKRMLEKLVSAGVMIDLAHLNEKSFFSVLEHVKSLGGRVFCSHTCFSEVCPHPRNINARQIRAIIDASGIIGLTFVSDFLRPKGRATMKDVVKHIDYFVKNFGADNLCLASDFYPGTKMARGIRCGDYRAFLKLKKILLKRGFSQTDVDKIFFMNAQRGLGLMSQTEVIGHSVLGKPIIAYHVGPHDKPQIIITGAIHAREWITELLVRELMKNGEIGDVGFWFIPSCNPDGVAIARGEIEPQGLPKVIEPKTAHLWKANARGVDLNVNFNAEWGKGAQNLTSAGSENYIGSHPESEPETKALADFTKRVFQSGNLLATIAYHSKGEVIYYPSEKDTDLAKAIGELTGYEPIKTFNELKQSGAEKLFDSAGGYSDWVRLHLGVPALTIEVGNDELPHPIGEEHLPNILAQNRDVPKRLAEIVLSTKKHNI